MKTNEVKVVNEVIRTRGISKSKLAFRMGISPQLLQTKLKDDEYRMSVNVLVRMLKEMDYDVALVPSWVKKDIKKDPAVFFIEEEKGKDEKDK